VVPIIDEFRLSMRAKEHIQCDHGVEVDEALEAAESTRRHNRTHSGRFGGKRYVIAGRTSAGRRLWVVFEDEGNRCGRIITAFEPVDSKDTARHRRYRGD
jgi:uncharacterized DUF497 family protein